ncbi:hypothetical protein AB2H31_01210 [Escherichia coli]
MMAATDIRIAGGQPAIRRQGKCRRIAADDVMLRAANSRFRNTSFMNS